MEECRRTRKIAYLIYATNTDPNKRDDEFDFMPLPGDPSKKQREREAIRQQTREMKQWEKKQKQFLDKVRGATT